MSRINDVARLQRRHEELFDIGVEAPHDRALRRAFKLRGKLGAEGGIGDYVPKPKWMRWRTYDRKLEEIFAAEEVVGAHLLGFVQKLERRPGR